MAGRQGIPGIQGIVDMYSMMLLCLFDHSFLFTVFIGWEKEKKQNNSKVVWENDVFNNYSQSGGGLLNHEVAR